jgi:hypothetical protein
MRVPGWCGAIQVWCLAVLARGLGGCDRLSRRHLLLTRAVVVSDADVEHRVGLLHGEAEGAEAVRVRRAPLRLERVTHDRRACGVALEDDKGVCDQAREERRGPPLEHGSQQQPAAPSSSPAAAQQRPSSTQQHPAAEQVARVTTADKQGVTPASAARNNHGSYGAAARVRRG